MALTRRFPAAGSAPTCPSGGAKRYGRDRVRGLLTDKYTYTHATSGAVDSRDVWLESFRSGRRRYQVYEIADVSLMQFPGVVVMTGRAHQEMNPRGEQIELNTRFTSVWVEQNGDW